MISYTGNGLDILDDVGSIPKKRKESYPFLSCRHAQFRAGMINKKSYPGWIACPTENGTDIFYKVVCVINQNTETEILILRLHPKKAYKKLRFFKLSPRPF